MNFKELKKYTKELTILYAEDDDDLREQTLQVFEKLFKHVDIASNGEEALELFQAYRKKHSKNYNLLLTDLQMPKLNGLELSKAVLELDKNQKIIIISAHDEKDVNDHMEVLDIKYLISKPLMQENMMEVIYEASK